MATMRDIKRRIKSVGSTQQITKAMNLVSASKLNRSKSKLEATMPFFNETRRTISDIVRGSKGINHQYLEQRKVKTTAILVMAGDRGLCGGYNSNVCKEAFALATEKGDAKIISIGTKVRDYFRRRRKDIVKEYEGISEKPFYEDAEEIGEYILEEYVNHNFDEVYLVYTEFKSILSHKPKVIKLLPVDASEFEEENSSKNKMNYEPNEEQVLDYVIPKYIDTILYGALVEAAEIGRASCRERV